MSLHVLGYVAIALVGVGLASMVVILGSAPPIEPQVLGLRGWKREQALAESSSFRALDPGVRLVAGWLRHLPLGNLRTKADRQLAWAGDYLGLDPDAYLAYCLLNAMIGLLLGVALVVVGDMPWVIIPALAVLTGYLQYSAVDEAMERRRLVVNRNLPGTIDLLSLCVSAGLTFPQAIKEVVEAAVDQRDPMVEELRLILRQVNLGQTRAFALEMFAARVPITAVRDFVMAVIQSDSKGTPLREVLNTQAISLRDRRSTRAEEAAASADVKLTAPLTIMMLDVLLIITGPMILKLMGNSMFGG